MTTYTTRRQWVVDLCILTCLLCIFYLFKLGHYPLFIPDEGRYTEVAREMVATHHYLIPRVDGVTFLDKPILYYWIETVAIHLFGLKEWSLRLFPDLFGVVGCLVTYSCGRLLFNRRTALLATAILATTPLYFACAHYADLNLEVAVLISMSLLFFITGIQQTGRIKCLLLLLAYTSAGLAFLTKGLIALAFPIMIIGAWMLVLNEGHYLKKMMLIPGLALFLVIVLPWFVLMQHANPAFFHYFFVTQQVSRFLSTAAFNDATPWWFYFPIVLFGFLPWTLFLLGSLWHKNTTCIMKRKRTQLFLWLWVSIVFVFFSIPHSKTIGYILPLFPALALLTAANMDAILPKRYLLSLFSACVMMNIFFLCILTDHADYFNHRSSKNLTNYLLSIKKPQDEVANYFQFLQDVPIYLNSDVVLVADWQSPLIPYQDNWVREMWYGMPFQDTSKILISEKTFWQTWRNNKRIFVFVNKNYFQQFKQHAPYYYFLKEENGILLLSNQHIRSLKPFFDPH